MVELVEPESQLILAGKEMKTLILLLLLVPQDKGDLKTRLKDFDQVLNSDKSTDEQKIEAVRTLAATRNDATLKALKPWLIQGSLPIRILTARHDF